METEELEERQEYIKIVRENNDLLLQLISDILDLSKIEAGTFEFTNGDVDVYLLCEDIVRSMRMKAKGEVELVLDNHLSSLCSGISGNLMRFFWNLGGIDNLKFFWIGICRIMFRIQPNIQMEKWAKKNWERL